MAPRYAARLRHVLALVGGFWQALVETALDILEALHNLEEAVKEAADLQKLYDVGVISDGLLQCLNGGLDDWSCCLTNRSATSAVVSAGNSQAGSAAAQAAGDSGEASPLYSSLEEAQDALLQLLKRRLLSVDEHPTVTRMLTFKPHAECLLLMDFLRFIDDVVKLRPLQPREQNSRRISKVLAFMHAADTWQLFRRTALAWCLTDHVQRISAQTKSCTEPLLVRLAKGTASRLASNDFSRSVQSCTWIPSWIIRQP
jgi:hypothetical protein